MILSNSRFRAVHSDSISTVPLQTRNVVLKTLDHDPGVPCDRSSLGWHSSGFSTAIPAS